MARYSTVKERDASQVLCKRDGAIFADLASLMSCPWERTYRGTCQWMHWDKHMPTLQEWGHMTTAPLSHDQWLHTLKLTVPSLLKLRARNGAHNESRPTIHRKVVNFSPTHCPTPYLASRLAGDERWPTTWGLVWTFGVPHRRRGVCHTGGNEECQRRSGDPCLWLSPCQYHYTPTGGHPVV